MVEKKEIPMMSAFHDRKISSNNKPSYRRQLFTDWKSFRALKFFDSLSSHDRYGLAGSLGEMVTCFVVTWDPSGAL